MIKRINSVCGWFWCWLCLEKGWLYFWVPYVLKLQSRKDPLGLVLNWLHFYAVPAVVLVLIPCAALYLALR